MVDRNNRRKTKPTYKVTTWAAYFFLLNYVLSDENKRLSPPYPAGVSGGLCISGSIQIVKAMWTSKQPTGNSQLLKPRLQIKANFQTELIFSRGWLTLVSSLPLFRLPSSHPQNCIISYLCYEKHLLEINHIHS